VFQGLFIDLFRHFGCFFRRFFSRLVRHKWLQGQQQLLLLLVLSAQ
jgi:hypothetical protein